MTDPIRKGFLDKINLLIKDANSKIGQIGIKPSELFGSYTNEYFSHDFNVAIKTLNSLKGYEALKTPDLKIFCRHLEQAKSHLSVIHSWLFQNDLTQNYNNQIKHFKLNVDQCLKILNPDEYTKNLEDKVVQQENTTKQAQEKAQKAQAETQQTKQSLVDDTTDNASTFFENNAQKYKSMSLGWATATIALVTMTIYFAWLFLKMAYMDILPIDDMGHYQFVRVSATSLFFLTFLFSATIWAGRMYRSYIHLEAVNTHKALSLQVVNKLRAGSMTPEAKDIIVTEAAKSIFVDPPTGLISDKSSNNSLTITDLIKPSSGN